MLIMTHALIIISDVIIKIKLYHSYNICYIQISITYFYVRKPLESTLGPKVKAGTINEMKKKTIKEEKNQLFRCYHYLSPHTKTIHTTTKVTQLSLFIIINVSTNN